MGEPGIGKSRLIRTLRERLGDEPYTPLSHYCSPYHINSALYPVIGLIERATRLDRGEPPEQQLTRLEAVLARSIDRPDEAVPLLAALLGVPIGERYSASALTPEVQKRRTLQTLVDQLAGLAAKQPVLALYEDVHWIDPSTLELLGLVVETEAGQDACGAGLCGVCTDIGKPCLDLGNTMWIGRGFGFLQERCAFLVGGEHDLDQRLVRARCFLRHLADPRVLRNGDRAGLGGVIPGDDAKQRRLAGAVAAHQSSLRA